MNKKFKRFNNFLISIDFTLVSEFKNLSTRVDIKCNKCGDIISCIPSNKLHTKTGCRRCYEQTLRLSEDRVRQVLNDKNITLVGKYTKLNEYHTLKCNICNHTWSKKLRLDKGCPECAKSRILIKAKEKKLENINNKFLENLSLNGFTLRTPPPKSNEWCVLYCEKCGTEFDYRRGNLLYCPECKKENQRSLTESKLIERLNSLEMILLTPYKDMQSKVKVKCSKCGYVQERLPCNIHRDSFMCISCYKKKYHKTQEQFEMEIKYEPYKLISKYESMEKPARFKCNLCGWEFVTEPYRLTRKDKRKGCPKCNASLGERKIMDILNNLGIDYEKEKTFDGLVSARGGYLRYDFYLPRYNMLIEYDGEQHFKDFGRFFDYESLKMNDQIKNEFAKEKGIRLLRIPYTKYMDLRHIILNEIENFSREK